MPLNPIGKLIARADELKALSVRARRARELHALYLRCAPPELGASSRVKALRNGTLVVAATNAATAAKLKQLAPTVIAAIRKSEPEVIALKVEMDVTGRYERRVAPAKKPLGDKALEQFDALAKSMPESGLKAAVTRLVRRHKR